MSRCIDADKLIAHLKDEIEGCCEPHYGARINGKSVAYGTVLGLKSAISFAETLSTTDVVPKNEWISVKDRLPEKDGMYLIFSPYTNKEGGIVYCNRFLTKGNPIFPPNSFESISKVTHWMPLPEAPKMKGE